MSTDESSALAALQTDMLRDLRVDLGPEQGLEAFHRHQILAIKFHRAALIYRPSPPRRRADTASWNAYFNAHVPRWRNVSAELFSDWRSWLLKHDAPGPKIAITHGHPEAHALRDARGRMVVDLGAMWDDYEASVGSLIAALRVDLGLRSVSVGEWRKQRWTVEDVAIGSVYVSTSITSTVATIAMSGTYVPSATP